MTPDQYPKNQDISLLAGTFEVAEKMLDAATNLFFELEQVKDTPEKVNQLPVRHFELFVRLLPALNSHCAEWRLESLTEDQFKQVGEIEHRLEKVKKLCTDSRSIMDYLLLQIPLYKIH